MVNCLNQVKLQFPVHQELVFATADQVQGHAILTTNQLSAIVDREAVPG